MDIHELRVGTPGTILPPFENVIKHARKAEEQGYDSAWWPDHLMGWIPESIWTPDIAEIAARQKSPHTYFESLTTIAAVACHTSRLLMGTSVTECFRRHPAMLAQAALTLDHISKGRFILGIGAGEYENIEPYGINYEKPASRLEEALTLIRLLWESEGKVNYDGAFWRLRDAVLTLEPYREGRYPPIWVAAHGKRTMRIAGRLGDGWFPTYMPLQNYKEGLRIVQDAAREAGRSPEEITPAMWCYVVIDKEAEECKRVLASPMIKAFALTLPYQAYEEAGYQHPLGYKSVPFADYVPTRYSRERVLAALEKVPVEVCERYILNGTPDDIIKALEDYVKVGLKHVVLWNITFFGDLKKVRSSFNAMAKVLEYIKG